MWVCKIVCRASCCVLVCVGFDGSPILPWPGLPCNDSAEPVAGRGQLKSVIQSRAVYSWPWSWNIDPLVAAPVSTSKVPVSDAGRWVAAAIAGVPCGGGEWRCSGWETRRAGACGVSIIPSLQHAVRTYVHRQGAEQNVLLSPCVSTV
ncbi:hypothetical protein BCR34DRAFT_565773 [Clohesyomyces aquaticus]|uniref:Secreted protein n=1 Tax=Clohesyomyces aquaticus TaxID=1231657 RepID=A0A1Y1ZMW9_9PLEO|nr:hypothetical protein BCR34DRAFT_565773 [Clohesyomyces aquaticus]